MARHQLTIEERSNGGKEGGKRRATVLTARRRREIARQASNTRWERVRAEAEAAK